MCDFVLRLPVSALEYVIRISPSLKPVGVPEDGGLGNEDLNAGLKFSNYGNAIQTLWKLKLPLTREAAREEGYVKEPTRMDTGGRPTLFSTPTRFAITK